MTDETPPGIAPTPPGYPASPPDAGESVMVPREPPEDVVTVPREVCDHDYIETSSPTDMEGETYRCTKCGDRYRLYYEDMA